MAPFRAVGTGILVVCFALGTASAALVAPGSQLDPAPAEPAPSGTVLASNTTPFTSSTLDFSGTLVTQVIADTTNPHGGLTFTYEFTSSTGSMDSIERLTGSSFLGFLTDASYVSGSGVAPATISRNLSGHTVGFNFTGGVQPGQSSTLLVIRTDAPQWTDGFVSLINGGTATVQGYAPIPEPAALSLLAGAGMLLLRRRVCC